MYPNLLGRDAPVSFKVLLVLERLGRPVLAFEVAKELDWPVSRVGSALRRLHAWGVVGRVGYRVVERPYFFRTARRRCAVWEARQLCLFQA